MLLQFFYLVHNVKNWNQRSLLQYYLIKVEKIIKIDRTSFIFVFNSF